MQRKNGTHKDGNKTSNITNRRNSNIKWRGEDNSKELYRKVFIKW